MACIWDVMLAYNTHGIITDCNDDNDYVLANARARDRGMTVTGKVLIS